MLLKPPSPEPIFGIMTAYQRSAVMKAAIDLNVFTVIAEGATTIDAVSQKCGASERGISVLLDYLVVLGLLLKRGSHYTLTRDSALFLDQRSTSYVGNAIYFILHPTLVEQYRNTTEAIKAGGSVSPSEGTLTFDNPAWVNYAAGMGSAMHPATQAIADMLAAEEGQNCKVLDIGAGHGLFGIALAQRNLYAQIVAADWPNVLSIAEENAKKAGVVDRFTKLSGNALEREFGNGYDIAILANFLHHFTATTCDRLLRRVRDALKTNGRVVIVEFIPNEDRVSPPAPALFSMTMLVGTRGGKTYTLTEIEQMVKGAGFHHSEWRQIPASSENVIIGYVNP